MSEENILKQKHDDRYNAYVKEVTPTYNWFVKCIQAFIVGGIICTVGQCINWAILHLDITQEEAALWTTLALIFLSIVLTGLNIYPQIAKWGGAGSLVPITGFANSVVAPAIEFKKEGQVFGIGCKIFTIAGPVILYGIMSSWLVGIIYWFTTL